MGAWDKNIIANLGYCIPFSLLTRKQDYPVMLPFYHSVGQIKPQHVPGYFHRSTADFESDLEYLLKHYTPIDLQTLIDNNYSPKKVMHLSFDDGLSQCYSTIAPILKRKGIPATFFVNSNFVDNKNLFHRSKQTIVEGKRQLKSAPKKYFWNEQNTLDDMAQQMGISFDEYLQNNQPYMTLSELKSLQTDGFSIGAHSMDHPEFWTLSEDEQYKQVVQSVQWLKQNVNPGINAFAFPFTDHGVQQSLFERLNNEKLVDVTFGTAGLKYDTAKNHFQRIAMERKQNWSARKVVHFEYLYFFVRSFLGRNKVTR